MASTTIYASAGDGHIDSYDTHTNGWASARNGANLNAVGGAGTGYLVYVDRGTTFADATYYSYRSFFPFDLASLSGATITAATFNVYVISRITAGSMASSLYLCGSSQASISSLATSDFSTAGSTEFATTHPTVASVSTGAYLSLTLNASGLAALTPGGTAKLCVRNSYDWSNTDPSYDFSANYDGLTIDTSEDTNKPYLSITYTLPVGPSGGRRRPSGLYIR